MNFTVKVQTIPGGTEEFNSNESITVERAMNLAKVAKPENWIPKIGGEDAPLSQVISSNTTITLIKKQIKGNR